MLCQKNKKTKKKKLKVSPAIPNGGNEKKNLKKKTSNHVSLWRTYTCQAMAHSRHLKRREWRKRQKKNSQKWKWVILEKKFQRGSDLKIFLAIGSKKKIREMLLLPYRFPYLRKMINSLQTCNNIELIICMLCDTSHKKINSIIIKWTVI